MRRFINPILLFAAHSSHADLIRQIQYLKVENEILRSKLPKRFTIEPRERERLIRYGRAAGKAVFQLVSIVTRSCFYQWLRRGQPRQPRTTHPPGRPRTPEQVEELVLRLARETGWGYTRILGELKKLSIRNVSRSTVVNILKGAGLETGPKRGQATWDEFITRHAQSLWACDFLARRVLTLRGWKDAHILVFINVKSRLAWISPTTLTPTTAWVGEQATAFAQATCTVEQPPAIVMHDNDGKFQWEFFEALEAQNVTAHRLTLRSPNLNAYVERFIQTLQHECLNHFLIFGTSHMDYLVKSGALPHRATAPRDRQHATQTR